MIAVALALSASVGWGVADFLGGLKSRSTPVLTVLFLSQGVGVLVLALAVLGTASHAPTWQSSLYGSAAGLAAVVGVGSLYKGLAVGAMSIVTPITATGASIPVFVGLVSGDRPSSMQRAGLMLALIGVVFAARETPTERRAGVPIASGEPDRVRRGPRTSWGEEILRCHVETEEVPRGVVGARRPAGA